jgi:hypothetical protein
MAGVTSLHDDFNGFLSGHKPGQVFAFELAVKNNIHAIGHRTKLEDIFC